MYEVRIERNFSSAHFLRNYRGKDEPLHGHNWRARVSFRGRNLVEPEQYLVDFTEASGILDKIVEKIDYKNINEVPPFDKKNPSAENVAEWIYREFTEMIPSYKPSCVTVWETEGCSAGYIPEE